MEEQTITTVEEQETQGTESQAVETTEKPERTFTQEEVNKIVSDRLKRESAKHAEEVATKSSEANTELEETKAKMAALESQLAEMTKNNEVRAMKERVSSETGVPVSLLTAETEEACKAQAEGILAFSGTKAKYPTTKDGGETTPPTSSTKEEILAIKNEKERLKAIRENINLFS